MAATTGRWYRIGLTVSGRTAGNVVPILTGGTTLSASPATSNGRHADRLQAQTGNNGF